MIIDFHTHAFPERIAGKAMEILSRKAGNVIPFHDGSPGDLLRRAKKAGVDKVVVLNIATNPGQQKNVNDFAIEINGGDIISFGSAHPFAPDALEELERIHAAGLKGIKLHPEYQDFFVDDERVFPLYEKAAELGLITVFHGGVDIEYFEPIHNTPERMARALSVFGGGAVVQAHMGGYMTWHETEKWLVGKDIYLDTAYCYSRMPHAHASRIIRAHGADRILFGSDMPWSGSDLELRFIDALELNEEEKMKILGENARKMLGI